MEEEEEREEVVVAVLVAMSFARSLLISWSQIFHDDCGIRVDFERSATFFLIKG